MINLRGQHMPIQNSKNNKIKGFNLFDWFFSANFFQHSCAHMVLPCFSFLFPHLVERLTENHMFDALSVITVMELVARRYTFLYIHILCN
jgi:hypothetical protein